MVVPCIPSSDLEAFRRTESSRLSCVSPGTLFVLKYCRCDVRDAFRTLSAHSAQHIRACANARLLVVVELGRQELLVQFLHCCYSVEGPVFHSFSQSNQLLLNWSSSHLIFNNLPCHFSFVVSCLSCCCCALFAQTPICFPLTSLPSAVRHVGLSSLSFKSRQGPRRGRGRGASAPTIFGNFKELLRKSCFHPPPTLSH